MIKEGKLNLSWIGILSVLFFQSACFQTQPSVENPDFKVAQFDHAGPLNDCTSCHLSTAPKNPIHQMDHGPFIKINQQADSVQKFDCRACHLENSQKSNWKNWVIQGPRTGQNQKLGALGVTHRIIGQEINSCIRCHLNERPFASDQNSKFDHVKFGATGDCVSCHADSTTAGVGLDWSIEFGGK